MNTLDAIFTRRSVRKFLNRPVEPEKVTLLLRAAMCAPSALNEQPWHFVLIDDRGAFEQIMRIYPYAGMLKSAPLAILVCAERELEKAPGNWVLDCSCAAFTLLLAAHDQGLGAVWSGIYPEEDRMASLASLLKLPEGIKPLALLAVGYPDGALPGPQDRFRADRIHLNNWHTRYQG